MKAANSDIVDKLVAELGVEGLMSEFVTVARPYAKAAFDFAVEHQSVERWQEMLAFTAEVTRNEQISNCCLARLRQKRCQRRSSRFVAIGSTNMARTLSV